MGLYEVPLSLLGFGMGTMLANFHMCGIMLVLRAVFNMRVQEGLCVLCAWCLICQVVIFTLFYCLLDLNCGECYVISLYFVCCSVGVSVCGDSVCEFFGETMCVEVLLLDIPSMVFQRMCVVCL